jgi:dTDP-4-amino-4,6-dideoxygalactose transaminase
MFNGNKIKDFENSFAKYLGVSNALAVSNCENALECALAAAEIQPGDEVITTPFTFIATNTSILRQGAIPVFSDIDPQTFNISPDSIEKQITNKTKAIIPVHIFGHPANMDPIMEIARKNDLVVIEDCAQAIGAEYKGKKVGAIGDLGCFSLSYPKNMTAAGEGGMVTTNREDSAEKVSLIRSYGYKRKISRKEKCTSEISDEKQYWHVLLGFNCRMTQIQAAVGLVQLKKLDDFNQRRIKNAEYLTSNLKEVAGIITPEVVGDVKHVFNVYTVRICPDKIGMSRDKFQELLNSRGVEGQVYYPRPNYQQPIFTELIGFGGGIFPFRNPWNNHNIDYKNIFLPVVERTCKEVISLPVHHALTKKQLETIATVIQNLERDSLLQKRR